MNTMGLSLIFRMGCFCIKETVVINDKRYYVRNHIGDGGFSTVDLVEDAQTHRLYALKRITCHSPEDQKSALLEVEYHQMLQHPNILDCIGSALTGKPDLVANSTSEVLLLLPYFQRGTLANELERRAKTKDHFTEVFLLGIFRQICEGAKTFHETKPVGLAHRDLKTANILLADDYTPVIMDLGSVAKARVNIKNVGEARQLQDEAAERSSMPYRAPELFNVDSCCTVDERTDVWSLGCVLYAMCFFKSPFDLVYERGDSVALAVVGGNITIPENSPYSPELHEFIQSILRVEPSERPFVTDVIAKTVELTSKAEGKV